jgi:hypothetical protein
MSSDNFTPKTWKDILDKNELCQIDKVDNFNFCNEDDYEIGRWVCKMKTPMNFEHICPYSQNVALRRHKKDEIKKYINDHPEKCEITYFSTSPILS